MLPNISIDNERYSDIIDDARNMIVSLYPEWTDFNYHDPGITLLELFSWIKESQQYYADRIGDENRGKYLKLLGLCRRRKIPARAEVSLITGSDIDVLKGTKFYAGDTCFEAEERRYILSGDIVRLVSFESGKAVVTDRRQLDFGGKAKILPFGNKPESGKCFYIGFERPLPTDTVLRARIGVFEDYEVKRAPIEDWSAFYPLAEIVLEVGTTEGWREAEIISDETCSLLRSGSISFRVNNEMKSCPAGGYDGFYLRMRLARCEYDVPPVIESICFNSIAVRQRDTQSEVIDLPIDGGETLRTSTELSINGVSQLFAKTGSEYHLIDVVVKSIDEASNSAVFKADAGSIPENADGLRLINTTSMFANSNIAGFGTGLPFQVIDLNRDDAEYESFEIMTEDPETENRYYEWTRVSDFAASSPEDRHYVFDSSKGLVKFGDCNRTAY